MDKTGDNRETLLIFFTFSHLYRIIFLHAGYFNARSSGNLFDSRIRYYFILYGRVFIRWRDFEALRVNHSVYRTAREFGTAINSTRRVYSRVRIETFRLGGGDRGVRGREKPANRASIAVRQRIHGHLERCPNFHFLPRFVSSTDPRATRLPFREGVNAAQGWLGSNYRLNFIGNVPQGRFTRVRRWWDQRDLSSGIREIEFYN